MVAMMMTTMTMYYLLKEMPFVLNNIPLFNQSFQNISYTTFLNAAFSVITAVFNTNSFYPKTVWVVRRCLRTLFGCYI